MCFFCLQFFLLFVQKMIDYKKFFLLLSFLFLTFILIVPIKPSIGAKIIFIAIDFFTNNMFIIFVTTKFNHFFISFISLMIKVYHRSLILSTVFLNFLKKIFVPDLRPGARQRVKTFYPLPQISYIFS